MLDDISGATFLEDFLPIDVLLRGVLLGDITLVGALLGGVSVVDALLRLALLGDMMLVENFLGGCEDRFREPESTVLISISRKRMMVKAVVMTIDELLVEDERRVREGLYSALGH